MCAESIDSGNIHGMSGCTLFLLGSENTEVNNENFMTTYSYVSL